MTTTSKCDFGLIGLAVMGENLALNIESRGFSIAVFNRTTSKVDDLINGRAKGKNFVGCHSLEELVASLSVPRKVMLMVKAGPAVDEFIEKLIPLLSPGDVIIDGGNTLFSETERRTTYVESKGLLYIGTGVSGGEEGALKGPSMMPGGSEKAWPLVKPIFQAIAAKVGPNGDIPCCEWVGPRGAGHYVKMVHNGIEYGDMQLICEAYWMLKNALGLSNDELYDVFQEWYEGDLNSYLIEITRDIFSVKDPDGDGCLIDKILDTAGAKGTGKWMSQLALDLGRAEHAGDRSGLRPVPVGDEGRPGSREQVAARTGGQIRGRSQGVRRAYPAGALCVEDLQLCAGLRANAGRGGGAQVAVEIRADRASVAGRVHHPRGVFGTHQGSVRCRAEPGELAFGPVFHPGGGKGPAGMAERGQNGGRVGHSHAGVLRGIGLLRRLSLGQSAGEFAASAARLLRRPHV